MDEKKKKALEVTLATIEKNFGKGSIIHMGSTDKIKVDVIPTGCLTLDKALGVGGIPRGRVVEIYGPESSGKTTLLNCLMQEIPSFERVISVEETAELSCSHPHWVRLLSRPSNSEQAGEISLGDLVKATLRMRPDRIVVGEVRSIEAFDLMQALNTGHDGSLCTIHANGPLEVLSRLSSLALLAHPGLNLDSIKSQFCFGIDAIVFVSKDKTGKRTINSISYLNDIDEANVLFDFETGAKFNV